MDITAANLELSFFARSAATQEGLAGVMKIGDRLAVDFALTDLAYSFKVAAAAPADVATLTHSTGAVAQTTGTPTITDGDGKDWEGVTLPVAVTSLVYLVVVLAGAANTGTVTLAAGDGAESPAGILRADGFLILGQPSATAVSTGSTLALTFSAIMDTATVWVFAKSA